MAIATINPTTGETLKTFEPLTDDALEEKLARAAAAARSYRRTTPEQRAGWLRSAADVLDADTDAVAELMTTEMGKTLASAKAEVGKCAAALRWYAERGPALLEPQPYDADAVGAAQAYVVHQPLGVVLAVMPWNFPLWQAMRFAAPALMAGNVGLLKHASNVPQTALYMEELFVKAGFPDHVFQTLLIGSSTIERVLRDDRVAAATLTGSAPAGQSVASIAGDALKPTVLELGGSDPFIVLDADDMEATVKAATAGRMQNTGQACTASKRLIVTEDVYEPFVQGLKQAFGTFAPGDPSDPTTSLAPLSSERAASDLHAQIQDAIDKGATVVAGGKRPEHAGAFVEATILTDVTPEMRAYREELFGPAAVVYKVKDAAAAVALANDSDFGLGATVMSSDVDRAREVADQLEAGMVWINQPTGSSPELPFGGIKRSGYGRELSELAMFEFANRRLLRTVPVKKAEKPQAG